MSDHPAGEPATEFNQVDLTGADFRNVPLNDARFRMCDLSGVVMRAVLLSGAALDGQIDGLRINGVEVAPLIEAELTRRQPARGMRRATDPEELRAAWTAVQQDWAATYERVATMPDGTVDISVDEEWSFAETLRHLVFATDAWLGAILAEDRPFHPWGVPFTDLPDFIDESPADIGIDMAATPSYAEVLDMRRDRVAKVSEFLRDVSPERLSEEREGPLWNRGPVSALRCLRVILNEELEHHRFAERDLDLIDAG